MVVLKIEQSLFIVATISVFFGGGTNTIGITRLVKTNLLYPAQTVVITRQNRQATQQVEQN